MILPIGHEAQTVRRLPWITFVIMAICLVAHIMVSSVMKRKEVKLAEELQNFFKYYIQHPYLEIDPELEKLFFINEEMKKVLETSFPGANNQPIEDFVLEGEQEKLDLLTDSILDTIDSIPFRKYGMTPIRKTFTTMVTYMFLHGDWWHLIFNMLFLYLTGAFIEDVWGRTIFVIFYFIAGILAAQMFCFNYPQSSVPLVGASGAVAGLMGAFLVRNWRVKIRFLYFFSIIFSGTFKAPAWLMLPLWFGLEFLNAKAMDSLFPGGGGGVAHWAHIWGFIIGVLVALGMKYFKIEEKYIHPKIQKQISLVNESLDKLEEARRLLELGEMDEAFPMLISASRDNPKDIQLNETLWGLAIHMKRHEEAAPLYTRFIENEIKDGEYDHAFSHYWHLKQKVSQPILNIQLALMLADQLTKDGRKDDARLVIGDLAPRVTNESPPGVIAAFAGVALLLESRIAERALAMALAHPFVTDQSKAELKARSETIGIKQEGTPRDRPPEDVVDALLGIDEEKADTLPGAKLDATDAVPKALQADKIYFEIKDVGVRALSYNRIRGLAIVKISPSGSKPYVLIDLFMDDPFMPSKAPLRTVRFTTAGFNPQEFVPKAANLKEAFQSLMNFLLKKSGAKAFPDVETVLLKKKLMNFTSLGEYALFAYSAV